MKGIKSSNKSIIDKGRITWLITGGVLFLLGVGVLIITLITESTDPVMGGLWLAGIGGGAAILFITLRKGGGLRTITQTVVVDGVEVKAGPLKSDVNALNIYGFKDANNKVHNGSIKFEKVEEPQGQPWRYRKNNRAYYVNNTKLETMNLEPFYLPDKPFIDPAVAARYLQLPAQRKYLRHRDSFMKFIGPTILGLIFVAEIIWYAIATGNAK